MNRLIAPLLLAGLVATACLRASDPPKPQSTAKSQAAAPGSLVLKSGRLRIISASRGSTYNSGGLAYALPGMKEGEEVLTVVGEITSGKPSDDELNPWLTDKSDAKVSDKPVALSKGNERTWLFKVPVSVGALVLHFQGGAQLPLAPFLKKTP